MTDQETGWITGLAEPLRVTPRSSVQLPADVDPDARLGVRKKEDGQNLLRRGVQLLAEYQELLAAQKSPPGAAGNPAAEQAKNPRGRAST